jgi:DNA-binding transcriptional ArsR family regulator
MVNYRPVTGIANRESLDRVFHALADPTRRDILAHLAAGAATVTELAAPHTMSLPSVSKHLKVLEQAGLLRRRIDGRVHHISLSPEGLRAAAEWLDFYRLFWGESLDRLTRVVEEVASAAAETGRWGSNPVGKGAGNGNGQSAEDDDVAAGANPAGTARDRLSGLE